MIDQVTVAQVTGGARSIKCMLWDTSLLDAEEGIRFRGTINILFGPQRILRWPHTFILLSAELLFCFLFFLTNVASFLSLLACVPAPGLTIPECQRVLPSAHRPHSKLKGEPLPESILWLLMTGEVPTPEQSQSITKVRCIPKAFVLYRSSLEADSRMYPRQEYAAKVLLLTRFFIFWFSQELYARQQGVPAHVEEMIAKFPKNMHPMTQLSAAVTAMQTERSAARACVRTCVRGVIVCLCARACVPRWLHARLVGEMRAWIPSTIQK